MNVLISPASFKGSLTAIQAAEIIAECIPETFKKKILPLADGGDDTVDVLHYSLGGIKKVLTVQDPFGKLVKAEYLLLDSETAVIDITQASGLKLVEKERNPALFGSTYGTGELIEKVLNIGVKKILLGLGGSSTADGGLGLMRALGCDFLNKGGKPVKDGGFGLNEVNRIDTARINVKLKDVEIILLCDVKNKLFGKTGGIKIYSPQKGASEEDIKFLENAFLKFVKLIKAKTGKSIENLISGGSAGGVASGLWGILNCPIVPGAKYIMDMVEFSKYAEYSDFVVTGEGKIDSTTDHGKVISSIIKQKDIHNYKVIAFSGEIDFDKRDMFSFSISPGPVSLEESKYNVRSYLKRSVHEVFSLIEECCKTMNN